MIAELIGLNGPQSEESDSDSDLAAWTFVLAGGDLQDGMWHWKMHSELAEALQQLKAQGPGIGSEP